MNNNHPIANKFYWIKYIYNAGCYSIAKRIPPEWDCMQEDYEKAHWKVLETNESVCDSSVTEYHLIVPPPPVILELIQCKNQC